MPTDKAELRRKLKEAGKRIPAWLQDKKSPPKQTEAQKKKKAKEAEMKRLKAQKATRGKEKDTRTLTEISRGGTAKQKAAAKAQKAGDSEAEKLLKKAREREGHDYFKKRR